jgi:hypothetical protein
MMNFPHKVIRCIIGNHMRKIHHVAFTSFINPFRSILPLLVKGNCAYVVPQAHEFSSDFQLTKAIKQELATLTMDYMIFLFNCLS